MRSGRLIGCAMAIGTISIGFGACGSSDADTAGAESAVQNYLQAVYSPDPVSACNRVSADAEAQLVEEASLDAPGAPEVNTCEDAIRFFATIGSLDFAAAGVMDFDLVAADAADEQVEAESTGEHSASATVGESTKEIALAEDDGEWSIAEFDFSDLPD